MFAVIVESATVRIGDQTAAEQQLPCVQEWDPARGVVCEGHPTVMAFNMYDHPITVEAWDISATVCPMMEFEVLPGQERWKDSESRQGEEPGRPRAKSSCRPQGDGAGKQPEFPEFLCRMVAPEDQPGVQDQFDRYTKPGDLAKNMDANMCGLKIHPDNKMVRTSPWMKIVKERLETPGGNQAHMKETAAQWSLGIPEGDQEGVALKEPKVEGIRLIYRHSGISGWKISFETIGGHHLSHGPRGTH